MPMQLNELAHIIELWAPPWAAWEKDNVGIQLGRVQKPVKKVLVCLDVTEQVAQEAVKGSFDVIVSHHPLLFRMPKTITDRDETGRIMLMLSKSDIAVYSAHTNLDSAKGGVSYALAEKIGMKDIRLLSPIKDTLAKITVFVPASHVSQVREAMTNAGGGVIGEYDSCTFQTNGTGSFRASVDAKPFIGTKGIVEFVEEVRLEMIAPRERVASVVSAMKSVHPYEEVAFDVVNIQNANVNFGLGAIGDLPKAVALGTFLKQLKKSIGSEGVRYSGKKTELVRHIAVCGGSGSELLEEAIRAKADVFVTADIRYHAFQSSLDRIALVDAGHYETEAVVLRPLAAHIKNTAAASGIRLTVSITNHVTNPMHWA